MREAAWCLDLTSFSSFSRFSCRLVKQTGCCKSMSETPHTCWIFSVSFSMPVPNLSLIRMKNCKDNCVVEAGKNVKWFRCKLCDFSYIYFDGNKITMSECNVESFEMNLVDVVDLKEVNFKEFIIVGKLFDDGFSIENCTISTNNNNPI